MLAAIRAAKGQGNSALYVRFRDSVGQYWNFSTSAWAASEAVATKSFLTEYADADILESRYQSTVVPPVGLPVVAEYVRDSDKRVLAEESDGLISYPVQRLLGLGGANRVLDQEVLDANKRVLSARIRIYDTQAHAVSSGTTGLLGTYNVSASYLGSAETTMIVTEVLP